MKNKRVSKSCLTEPIPINGRVIPLDTWWKMERLVVHPEIKGGNLYTKEEFDNFVYRFEFLLTPGANNGIGVRAPLEGDAAYVGMEIQVLDNEADKYKSLENTNTMVLFMASFRQDVAI